MSHLTTKNLLKNGDIYNRYYGDFRGVDFSNDHTQVIEQRFAYAVNMYKDYQSGQGKAVETIPGFRRRVVLPEEAEIYGIHNFRYQDNDKILIHAGTKLYLWHNYPNTVGVINTCSVTLPQATSTFNGIRRFDVPLENSLAEIVVVYTASGENITSNVLYDQETNMLQIEHSDLFSGDILSLSYYEGTLNQNNAIYVGMNTKRSTSFVFYGQLYIVDGKNYLVYDGNSVKKVTDVAYVPTTYINILPAGENADIGKEYEHRNILQPKFKHTFFGDGNNKIFYMNENELNGIAEVKVYGVTLKEGEGYKADLSEGKIELTEAPVKPADKNYPETYAGVEITAIKEIGVSRITDCTIAAIFDGRVFLSGNSNYPNNIYFCGRNNITGDLDPTYFPNTNYVTDGVGAAMVTGMLVVADTLMVLKSDTQQDGSVYFHTSYSTGDDLHPVDYPSTRGLAGIGCLGACINFLDDPIFISRLGVEAVGQLSTRLERAIEHRSSLIDAKLVNMNLKNTILEEWNGYLITLVDGKIFMADSRQKYTHDTGVMQYEWYYLENIGIWKNQYPEYRYVTQLYSEFEGIKIHYCTRCKKSVKGCSCQNDLYHIEIPITLAARSVANEPGADGISHSEIFDETIEVSNDGGCYNLDIYYTVNEVYNELTGEIEYYEAHPCENKGNYTGGTFKKACMVKCIDNNLFFGTANGIVCSFNFDKRNEDGEIPTQYYSFDGRTINCGCATKMDCCGIPHLTKNTVKKSTVIKTKSLQSSTLKIKVRTNKKPYEQIDRINSSLFSFENTDFSDYSFITTEQSLFSVKEKEKQWVEKQYYVYSDEYLKPFALYYISFRYRVAGRYKD